jgi:hypothetical protein
MQPFPRVVSAENVTCCIISQPKKNKSAEEKWKRYEVILLKSVLARVCSYVMNHEKLFVLDRAPLMRKVYERDIVSHLKAA